MGRRPLWTSGVAFLALLAVTWVLLKEKPTAKEEPFFALKRRTPDTLQVTYAGDTTVVAARGEGEWQVISPVDYPADPLVISSMITRLADLQVGQVFPLTPEKMDTYGMRHPRAVIRAAYRDGPSPDTLSIGAFSLGGAYDYVRAGSVKEVALLESRVADGYLLKNTMDIRDTRLMPFYATRAQRLELYEKGQGLVAAMSENDGSWRITAPYPGPADAKEIGEYLNSVSHMHIQEFVREGPGPLAPFGLDAPVVEARVVTREGDEYVLRLGDHMAGVDRIYAITAARPHVMAVSDKYLPVLQKSADAFRLRAPVTFGLDDVDSLQVRGSQGNRTFVPGGEGPVDEAQNLETVLGNWIKLRADEFAAASRARLRSSGLMPPQGTLIWWGGGDTLAVMDMGRTEGELFPIRVSGGERARPDEILLLPEPTAIPLWDYLRRTAGAPAPG